MPTISDTITTTDGSCPITLTRPEGNGRWPAVILYPDAGGVRTTFRDMAQQLSAMGYVVLLPDVYYRSKNWAPFDMETVFTDKAERQRLFSMISSVTPEAMESDARAFFGYLAARPEVEGESFGTTGYCMGGRTSLVVAGRVPECVGAAMSFHGGGLASDDPGSPHLLAGKIRGSVYVGAAENDPSFTPDQAELLASALTEAEVDFTIEWYAAPHGFAVPDNAPYDEASAARHWAAMQDFFGTHLPGGSA